MCEMECVRWNANTVSVAAIGTEMLGGKVFWLEITVSMSNIYIYIYT